MDLEKLGRATAIAALLTVAVAAGLSQQKSAPEKKGEVSIRFNQIPADVALTGVPLHMTPAQLPDQFSTQLRDDVDNSKGIAILRQKGNDLEYTFAWESLTSPVISAHFHYGPHDHVGARAYPICGVANESPACPPGNRNSISGVWQKADLAAINAGNVVIAFHTKKYPAPIGELAVYIPAKRR